jgi:EAL domain-containing protein (putative c-di-GMP-specific phosphodiesterase class I)
MTPTVEKDKSYFKREFQICYQPVFSLLDQHVESFEALLRWQPEREVLFPEDFIPLIEETGLIIPVGEWLLQETANQLAHWQQQFPLSQPQISVNLSPQQLAHPELLAQLAAVNQAVRYGKKALQVEIPARYLTAAAVLPTHLLNQIHQQGIEICLDDVEPVPYLLTLLKQCPVSAIKYAMTLTQTAAGCPSMRSQVRSFSQAVRALGVKIIAKGIETSDHQSWVDALGCQYGQGYLFDPPLPLNQAVARLVTAERKAIARSKAASLDGGPLGQVANRAAERAKQALGARSLAVLESVGVRPNQSPSSLQETALALSH